MKYCIIETFTQTSTFRNPEFQNYHKSFTLPPPTTVIGFAGAALGLSPKQSLDYFDIDNKIFKFGIYGSSQGLVNDLWKYNDFKTGSVINREILFLNQFIIIFYSNNETKINDLTEAFINPKYALTLGSSDSVAKIRIGNNGYIEEKQSDILENCLIDGNIIEEVLDNIDNELEFSIYSNDSVCFDLPVNFDYSSDYGFRKVNRRKKFSFVNKKMKLNIEKSGIFYKNVFIPLFDL